MVNYNTGINAPHNHKLWLYDDVSGYYRNMLASDLQGGENTTTKITAPNGQPVDTINALPVQAGGSSATAFGETLTASQNPQIEAFAAAAHDTREWEIFSGANDGYVYTGTGHAVVEVGSTFLAYSTLRTVDFLPYTPGQGMSVRFTAAFDTGAVPNSLQLAGPYHAEDGFAFGYNGDDFGIMHRYGRKLHTEKLTLSAQATSASTVTVNLNGTPNTVAVNANLGLSGLARDIATGVNYVESGVANFDWQAFPVSGDVYFMRTTHGPITGAMSYNAGSTSSAGSFSQFQSGENGTVNWISQSGWSYDSLTGDGPSAMTLQPQNLNIFEIKYGWLGALPIKFSVGNENCQELIPVHVEPWTNQNQYPSVIDPRFPISFAVASAGSTTPLKMKTASCFGSIEGKSVMRHKQFSHDAEKTASTTETPILSVLNGRFNLQERNVNRRRIDVESVDITNESSTKAAVVSIYFGHVEDLQNWQFAEPTNLSSIAYIDTDADGISTAPDNTLQKLETFGVAPQSNVVADVNKYLTPKQVMIITCRTSSSSAPIIVSVNGWEDV